MFITWETLTMRAIKGENGCQMYHSKTTVIFTQVEINQW